MASDEVTASPQIKYDVFVNFRGMDTRNNFFSCLKDALVRNGINAFTDEGLNAGEEISPTLDSKISESQASVVVFSPNYADSWWCLDELVRIMECKEANGQTVLPVFVQGVDPTHVRKQIGAFGEGFRRLIQDARYANRKESWERALKQAAGLAGMDTRQISEGVTIQKLLKSIQSILSPMSSIDLNKSFIGSDRVEKVESLMSSPRMRCLGIWGMGGSGKTTLAKKIYERVSNKFDASCFVEKVGEFAGMGKLNRLHMDLMSQLLKNHDASQGPPTIHRHDIQRKLGITKVLVILDDLSDPSQLQELIGDWSLYTPGSKIVAISRNQQILKNIVCDEIYEVKALDYHKSFQLLKYHILKKREPTMVQMKVLEDAIKYTGGLPLALKVLGRNLFDKDITIWKSELGKLYDKPNLDVTKILRTSFDGLDDDEKNIFLDISCLMKGWKKDKVESILDACGFHAVSGVDRLVDRALVTVSNQKIQIHDLLQQMGQDIASREGTRLCKTKEIVDLLTRNQVGKRKRKLEVISMDLSHDTSMELSPRVFKKMTRLRILRFKHDYSTTSKISLPGGLKYLPATLRYLEWELCPEKSLPSRFNPENLVELRMRESSLRHLWTGEIEPCLPCLKHVDLHSSKNLTMLPNFRNSLNLETLQLRYCKNLQDVPDFSQLTKLVKLDLEGCSEFRILRQLPPSLIELNLSFTKIKKLENSSIQELSQLERLALTYCEQLECLPDNICVLKNIEKLELYGCQKLLSLPSLQMHIIQGSTSENPPTVVDGLRSVVVFSFPWYNGEKLPSLKSLVSLEILELHGSNVRSLPEDIKYLTNLWRIDVSYCKILSCIPELPPSLLYLNACNCASLQEYTNMSSWECDPRLSPLDVGKIYDGSIGYLHMRFYNCYYLEKDVIDKIWRDFLLRVQLVLNRILKAASSWGHDRKDLSSAYIQGDEVPEWFEYSDTGTSIQVNTNCRIRLRRNFLLFCVVIDIPTNLDRHVAKLHVSCICQTQSGETFYSFCDIDFGDVHNQQHTIVWCCQLGCGIYFADVHDQVDLHGATFRFFAEMICHCNLEDIIESENDDVYNGDLDSGIHEYISMCLEIVKCGITPIRSNDNEDDNKKC